MNYLITIALLAFIAIGALALARSDRENTSMPLVPGRAALQRKESAATFGSHAVFKVQAGATCGPDRRLLLKVLLPTNGSAIGFSALIMEL